MRGFVHPRPTAAHQQLSAFEHTTPSLASLQIYDEYRAKRPMSAPFRRAADVLRDEREGKESTANVSQTGATPSKPLGDSASGLEDRPPTMSSLPVGRPLAMPGLRGGAGAAYTAQLGGGGGYLLGSPTQQKRPATALLRGTNSSAFDKSAGHHDTYSGSVDNNNSINTADAHDADTHSEAPAPTPAMEPFISGPILKQHHAYMSDVLVGLWTEYGIRSSADRYRGWSSPSPSIVLAVCTPNAVRELNSAVLRLAETHMAPDAPPRTADLQHHALLFGVNDRAPSYRHGLLKRVTQLVNKKLLVMAEAAKNNQDVTRISSANVSTARSHGHNLSSLPLATSISGQVAEGLAASESDRGGAATARPHLATATPSATRPQSASVYRSTYSSMSVAVPLDEHFPIPSATPEDGLAIRRVGPPSQPDVSQFNHSVDSPYVALASRERDGVSPPRVASASTALDTSRDTSVTVRTPARTQSTGASPTATVTRASSPMALAGGGGVNSSGPRRSPASYRHRLAIVHTQHNNTAEKGTMMTPRPSESGKSNKNAPKDEDDLDHCGSEAGEDRAPQSGRGSKPNWYQDARDGITSSNSDSSSFYRLSPTSKKSIEEDHAVAETAQLISRLSSDEEEGRAVIDALQDALKERVRKLMLKDGERLRAYEIVELGFDHPRGAGKPTLSSMSSNPPSAPPTRRPSEVARLHDESSYLMVLYSSGESPIRARHNAREASTLAFSALEKAEADDRIVVLESERMARLVEVSHIGIIKEEAEARQYITAGLEAQARDDIRFKMHYAGMELFPEERAIITEAYLEQYQIECEEATERKALQKAIVRFITDEEEGTRAEDAAIAIQGVFRKFLEDKHIQREEEAAVAMQRTNNSDQSNSPSTIYHADDSAGNIYLNWDKGIATMAHTVPEEEPQRASKLIDDEEASVASPPSYHRQSSARSNRHNEERNADNAADAGCASSAASCHSMKDHRDEDPQMTAADIQTPIVLYPEEEEPRGGWADGEDLPRSQVESKRSSEAGDEGITGRGMNVYNAQQVGTPRIQGAEEKGEEHPMPVERKSSMMSRSNPSLSKTSSSVASNTSSHRENAQPASVVQQEDQRQEVPSEADRDVCHAESVAENPPSATPSERSVRGSVHNDITKPAVSAQSSSSVAAAVLDILEESDAFSNNAKSSTRDTCEEATEQRRESLSELMEKSATNNNNTDNTALEIAEVKSAAPTRAEEDESVGILDDDGECDSETVDEEADEIETATPSHKSDTTIRTTTTVRAKRNVAAVKIQKTARAHSARRTRKALEEERVAEVEDLRRHEAAVRIQCMVRCRRARDEVERRRFGREPSVYTIASTCSAVPIPFAVTDARKHSIKSGSPLSSELGPAKRRGEEATTMHKDRVASEASAGSRTSDVAPEPLVDASPSTGSTKGDASVVSRVSLPPDNKSVRSSVVSGAEVSAARANAERKETTQTAAPTLTAETLQLAQINEEKAMRQVLEETALPLQNQSTSTRTSVSPTTVSDGFPAVERSEMRDKVAVHVTDTDILPESTQPTCDAPIPEATPCGQSNASTSIKQPPLILSSSNSVGGGMGGGEGNGHRSVENASVLSNSTVHRHVAAVTASEAVAIAEGIRFAGEAPTPSPSNPPSVRGNAAARTPSFSEKVGGTVVSRAGSVASTAYTDGKRAAVAGNVATEAITVAEGIRFTGGAPTPAPSHPPSMRGRSTAADGPVHSTQSNVSLNSTLPSQSTYTGHRVGVAGGVAEEAIAVAEGIRFAGGAPSVEGDMSQSHSLIQKGGGTVVSRAGSVASTAYTDGKRAAVAGNVATEAITVAEGIRFTGGAPTPAPSHPPSMRSTPVVPASMLTKTLSSSSLKQHQQHVDEANGEALPSPSVSSSVRPSSKRSAIMAAVAAAADQSANINANPNVEAISGADRARPATAPSSSDQPQIQQHQPPRVSSSATGVRPQHSPSRPHSHSGRTVASTARSAGTSTIVRHARINAVLEFIDAMERIKADESDVRSMLEEDELFDLYVCQCHWPLAFPIPLVEHAQPQDHSLLRKEEEMEWQHILEREHTALAFVIQRAAVEEVRRSTNSPAMTSYDPLSATSPLARSAVIVGHTAMGRAAGSSSRPTSAKRLVEALKQSSTSDSLRLPNVAL